MSLSLLVPPAAEPVDLARLKLRLRISDNTHDQRLAHLISVARERVERETGRVFLTQTWLETRDSWDGDGRLCAFATQFKLLKPPLIAVESITVTVADGTPTTWPASEYYVDSAMEPGRIVLRRDSVFPEPGRAAGGIAIRYRAGYGASAADVPAPLREAVSLLAADLFDTGGGTGLPFSVQSLIAPWRRLSL